MARARPETPKMREAFELWYAGGRSFRKTSQELALKLRTLYDWAERYDWYSRAETRDYEAQKKADVEAIEQRAKMLVRHARLGRRLQDEVAIYLKRVEKTAIVDMETALKALKLGIETERTAEGMPNWILDILKMSDDELQTAYHQYNTQESD